MSRIRSRPFELLVLSLFTILLMATAARSDKVSPPESPQGDKPGAKSAAKARLTGLAVEVEEKQVFVSCQLTDAFDETFERRISSGLATGIVFDFELVKKRRLWFNKEVEKGKLQVMVMYNAVSREYQVNYRHDGNLIDTRLVRDPAELQAALTEVEKLAVFSLEGKKGELFVRARAELGTSSILFFIPTLRTTDWVEYRLEIDKNGRPGAQPEAPRSTAPPGAVPSEPARDRPSPDGAWREK